MKSDFVSEYVNALNKQGVKLDIKNDEDIARMLGWYIQKYYLAFHRCYEVGRLEPQRSSDVEYGYFSGLLACFHMTSSLADMTNDEDMGSALMEVFHEQIIKSVQKLRAGRTEIQGAP